MLLSSCKEQWKASGHGIVEGYAHFSICHRLQDRFLFLLCTARAGQRGMIHTSSTRSMAR